MDPSSDPSNAPKDIEATPPQLPTIQASAPLTPTEVPRQIPPSTNPPPPTYYEATRSPSAHHPDTLPTFPGQSRREHTREQRRQREQQPSTNRDSRDSTGVPIVDPYPHHGSSSASACSPADLLVCACNIEGCCCALHLVGPILDLVFSGMLGYDVSSTFLPYFLIFHRILFACF